MLHGEEERDSSNGSDMTIDHAQQTLRQAVLHEMGRRAIRARELSKAERTREDATATCLDQSSPDWGWQAPRDRACEPDGDRDPPLSP